MRETQNLVGKVNLPGNGQHSAVSALFGHGHSAWQLGDQRQPIHPKTNPDKTAKYCKITRGLESNFRK